jgi:hypothetical protein
MKVLFARTSIFRGLTKVYPAVRPRSQPDFPTFLASRIPAVSRVCFIVCTNATVIRVFRLSPMLRLPRLFRFPPTLNAVIYLHGQESRQQQCNHSK